MATARTRNCSIELDSRGFVMARVDHGCEMNGDDARAAFDATSSVAAGRRRPVLVDLRGIRSQTREARDFFSNQGVASEVVAVALLVASPVSKVIGNFFLRLRLQPVPTQLFGDEQSAVEWLLEHVE